MVSIQHAISDDRSGRSGTPSVIIHGPPPLKESCTMISRREVEHVARLARLHFDEEELARLQPELDQIIGYVEQLSELDLSGLEPTSHAVPVKNVLRPDEPWAGLTHEEAMANGPAVERGAFVVPRIG
jgi:aspartyl-tRNA(Asn)/glutamyl-tRNA(Gln) amidotransferase subunit C